MAHHARIRAERERLRAASPMLLEAIAAILFRHDPIGINFDENQNEYDPEAGTILPRLRTAHSARDVQRIVREELERWFDASMASRAPEQLAAAAEEIWGVWQDHLAS